MESPESSAEQTTGPRKSWFGRQDDYPIPEVVHRKRQRAEQTERETIEAYQPIIEVNGNLDIHEFIVIRRDEIEE